MNDLSIRITHRHGDAVCSIDIDAFPTTPPVVQLAKADSTEQRPGLVDNGDGTITDPTTGLMWTRDDVADKAVNFKTAEKACAECRVGGHSDWVLPSRPQLLSLVDDTRHSPAIDTAAFPSCKSECYWTRTTYAASPEDVAWNVSFYDGGSSLGHRDGSSRVRAVRVASGQSSAF